MNIPTGSVSEGNILVISPWRNLGTSEPWRARKPRRGVKSTAPEAGI